MTQEQLAARLSVSVRTVSNWERSSTVPRNRIGALRDVLGPLHDKSEPEQPLLSEATPAEFCAELARRLGDPEPERDGEADGDGQGPLIPGPRRQS